MQVGQVELAPDGARVGMEIRVVGNDSGEKVRRSGRAVVPAVLTPAWRVPPPFHADRDISQAAAGRPAPMCRAMAAGAALYRRPCKHSVQVGQR